jgi:hypothetical protein
MIQLIMRRRTGKAALREMLAGGIEPGYPAW